jgi:rubrerythrin
MDAQEALALAIKREKEAHEYYSDAAAKSTNDNGRKMFSWLASEEQGHVQILERQFEKVKSGDAWLSEEGWCVYGDISHPIECSELPSSSEVKAELPEDAPEMDVLQQAIGAERTATEFYAETARNTPDENGRAMFEMLSKVEQGHLDLLEEEYEWLSKSKAMFTIHRFSLGGR